MGRSGSYLIELVPDKQRECFSSEKPYCRVPDAVGISINVFLSGEATELSLDNADGFHAERVRANVLYVMICKQVAGCLTSPHRIQPVTQAPTGIGWIHYHAIAESLQCQTSEMDANPDFVPRMDA
ncbi:hypothetical protein D8B26_007732 [Coccidioides posadasii str. Silveira]|uniref:Predicted protein n=1 Tax=Coccidioides posadasii (strain RMSCC 757 / Silveira) TaxID=443226 RepID=E9D2U4_COCPS|nr:predicted protein [Coccidioides posadasii str. Silveira]QVM13116.1 hypothetical protein D8B26_007732 [Coccidioides posadasii str. Silveira]